MSNPALPSIKRTSLQLGVAAGLLSVFFHFLFYANNWHFWLFSGFVLLAATYLTTSIFYGIVIWRLRANPAILVTFPVIFSICVLSGSVAGIVGTVYDTVFYSSIDPEYDVKVIQQAIIQADSTTKRPESGYSESDRIQIKTTLKKQLDYAQKNPHTFLELLKSRMVALIAYGVIIGFLLGVVMRDIPAAKPDAELMSW
ncbi:MAG: DUF4199 family protein [Bacteroidia bacterium]|nr:DUF4199 family protein [Bacteroidia bacterium]